MVNLAQLDKLNPEKNGLSQVLKDFNSPVLTVRLNGLNKINRVIGYSNDLCRPMSADYDESYASKYREAAQTLSDWVLANKIIENIFGPNSHVEVIKQSHITLNFVAPSLTNEHIDVIWASSLMKHCGRQVFELLTSLVRFMRPSPVLHLYHLLKGLDVQDHSEHTLFLTSHVLRYIWSHSPHLNQHYYHHKRQHIEEHNDKSHQPRVDSDKKRGGLLNDIPTDSSLIQRSRFSNCEGSTSNYVARDYQNGNQKRRLSEKRITNLEVASSEEPGSYFNYCQLCISPISPANDQDGEKTTSPVNENISPKSSHNVTKEQSQHHDTISSKLSITTVCGDTIHGACDEENRKEPDCSDVHQGNQVSGRDCSNDETTDSPTFDIKSAEKLKEWLNAENQDSFQDNTSETSACCSEKNMADFDDTYVDEEDPGGQPFEDENTFFSDDRSVSSNSSELYNNAAVDVKYSPGCKATQHDTYKQANCDNFGIDRGKNIVDKTAKTEIKNENHTESPVRRLSSDDLTNDLYNDQATSISEFQEHKLRSSEVSPIYNDDNGEYMRCLSEYHIGNLSKPGKTLLWDLLQDDNIERLSLGLHSEIENVLVSLIMTFGHRFIRLKFIEACLENLSAGTSVIISLRLLPRLMSFSTPSRNLPLSNMTETHMIVWWAEKDYHMSDNFFKDFVKYSKKRQDELKKLEENSSIPDKKHDVNSQHPESIHPTSLEVSHMDKIITRLSFLTFIYSKSFSPPTMKLTIEQIDHLWDCLIQDRQCADVLFQWLINQSVTEDLHAADSEILDYILKEKLPTLDPETFSVRGLKLLEQLLWNKQDEACTHSLENPATQLLWNIGLRANTPEVSMGAIRTLNHFYIYSGHTKHNNCDKRTNFINQCMQQMGYAFGYFNKCSDETSEERLITIIQRALVLLRTHLEVFKSRWSFYLHVLQLNNEANLISHRSSTYEMKSIMSLRIMVQAASRIEKTTIEVQSNDYIGELRAAVLKWWYTIVEPYDQLSSAHSSSSSPLDIDKSNNIDSLSEFSSFLIRNCQSLRLVSQNQDIPIDMDDRQINELDLKDMQVVYVLPGNVRPNFDLDTLERINMVPPRSEIPSILFLEPVYFEQLLDVGQFLGSFRGKSQIVNSRAQLLSRRVWEIIQVLPTSPTQLKTYKKFGMCQSSNEDEDSSDVKALLLPDTLSPQRLLYSLQIIDILRSSQNNPVWSSIFISNGGLRQLFEILLSSDLLPADHNDQWNEWQQECLSSLLKLVYQFGTKSLNSQSCNSVETISSLKASTSLKSSGKIIQTNTLIQNPMKRLKRSKVHEKVFTAIHNMEDRFPIRQFTSDVTSLLSDCDIIFNKILTIMKSCAHCDTQTDYYMTVSTRAMLIHHLMNFLASWCLSDINFPRFFVSDYKTLIKSLILNDLDPSVRREACNGLFKLHLAATFVASKQQDDQQITTESRNVSTSSVASSTSSTSSNNSSNEEEVVKCAFSTDLLKCLIEFLPIALSMHPPKPIRNSFEPDNDILKDLVTPGCKDYFWLTCKLLDATPTTTGHPSQINDHIDMTELCVFLSEAIVNRRTFETRDFSVEDDGLRGTMLMMVIASRKNPSFKFTQNCYEFLQKLFRCLFATPNPRRRYLPKCKSPATRSTTFDLIIELVDNSRKNYMLLVQLLIQQHDMIVKNTYPTNYWPHDDSRSEVGFVGLVNLGATCYLATCIQHLFMIPHLRYAVLSIDNLSNVRHGETIKELQKMFAFMLESERKAYNPRSFCKNYMMDHQPLNIAEQKDMTEFLTDLIAKLEESSPKLREIIKNLFSGSLSNNVVSLDCNHISRTTEEFYTLRCQVTDMRNLNDSLDELTVKDTLEGDNKYTCSSCSAKVRAEKRACIVKLPRILCFNTMRYIFNMTTMTKEKVNTHFSFPLKLDMSSYLEKNLIKRQVSSASASSSSSPTNIQDSNQDNNSQCSSKADYAKPADSLSESPAGSSTSNDDDDTREDEDESAIYELIGVTVHTGTADGGHYYCFIRDCEDASTPKDRWYLFNDAEVKPFDSTLIGPECFGGEMTTKSYDAVNDRFMDISFEKTNSAYMLFYKRADYKYNSQSVALRYKQADIQHFNTGTSESSEPDSETENSDQTLLKPANSNYGSQDDEADLNYRNMEENLETATGDSKGKMNLLESRLLLRKTQFSFAKLSEKTYSDFELPRNLSNWIWADNNKFCRDKNVFEHSYYNFIWLICTNISNNLISTSNINDVDDSVEITNDALTLKTVHLAISFVLGTLMHSREKPTISNWTELLRKQISTSQVACDWLMNLIDEDSWLKQMLLKCPIEMIRQLFQRLCNDLTGSSHHKKLKLSR